MCPLPTMTLTPLRQGVHVCVGARRLGVRKLTGENLPHRGSYLPASGSTWEVWHQWNYADSGTEGKKRSLWGKKEGRGGEGEGSMGRESLSGRNQSSRRERKGRTKELRNENRYKRRGCDSRSEWWREWEKREKEAADSGGGGGCGWSAVIDKCFPWLLLRGEVTARVQEGLCSRSRPAELLWW